MQPHAHIAALIEVLGEQLTIFSEKRHVPADGQLHRYFRQRRYMGSKDRAAVAERYYAILRHLATLHWWVERSALPYDARSLTLLYLALQEQQDLAALTALFSGKRYAPASLQHREQEAIAACHGASLFHQEMPEHVRLNVPAWLYDALRITYGDALHPLLEALQENAPLDIRVNTLKASRAEVIAALHEADIIAQPTPWSATGLRIAKRTSLFTHPAFTKGWFEVQDEGSQLVAQLVQAKKGDKVIDMCAGAGGKTLAIAATMHNKGRILAWDVSAHRLRDLPKRLKRAGIDNVQWRHIASTSDSWIKRHKASADWVLLDVPCSGTGTWRRNPDMKWRFQPAQLEELCIMQRDILQSAARLVAPGGRLVYATCSILEEENAQQVAWFLSQQPDFTKEIIASPLPLADGCLRSLPHLHQTDGFFAAILHKSR
ncbi:MAG: RsmB/NOP family class I SAM-dependent RNA methyltransferase [Sphaerospermopsis sp. SIO1G2]|nr:RsmB/NOP family class I SAM-dependent RNA methyltransferase [Sphaerospermopsis sp. SIO1G2]